MHGFGLRALAVLVLSAGVLVAQAGDMPPRQASPGPDLVLSARACDLGSLIPGQRTARVLSLRNAGAEALEIRARTSVHRLDASLSTSRLPPGSEGELRVEFRPAIWAEGPFAEQVLLYSNDPDEPLVKVKVHGTLRSPVAWTPKVPMLGEVRRNDIQPLPELRISSKDGRPIGPLRPTSFVPFLQAEAISEASGSYTVRLTLDPSVPPGPLLGWLRIETNHPQLPVLEVPIRAQVLGDLVARPYRLDFGIVEEGQPATAEVSLENLGNREVHIVKAEPHLPTKAEVSLSRKGKGYQVRVRLPSSPPLWSLEGHINLYTDHPAEPVVQVPAVGWVRAKKPFDRAAAEGNDAGLFALIKAALFRDEEVSTEDFLTRILGGVRDDRAVSLLLRALGDDNWLIRMRAVEILGLLQSQKALEPVRRAVTDDFDEEVRRAAAAALVRIADKEALPDLLLALQDNDDWVREDAAALLGRIGDPQAIPALTRALSDEEEDVRGAAERALKELAGSDEKD